jgi:hypothetical protein
VILACQTILPQSPQATPPGLPAEPPTESSAPPSEASPQGISAVRGFAAVVGHTIEFREKNGTKYAEIQGPESAFWEADRLHIAGSMPAGSQTVPLLYFVFDNGESLVYRDPNGQAFTLSQGESFMGLTGIPARPVIAFSQLEYLPTSLRSKIYAGTAQNISSAAPLLTIDDPESWAIKVILLEAVNDVPTRVWYTRIAYGIGGDIVFEPRKGLWYLDVASGQTFQVLEDEAAPWDLSPDHTRVAYSNTGSGQPGGMALRDLQSGASVAYPLRPASEPRGAGNAHFSPDGRYLAWMEGEGWMMADVPTFHATVRVGDLNGNVLAEFSDIEIGNALPGGKAAWIQPVGWLDTQTLLIQARGQNWEEAAIMKIDLPSKNVAYLAPGVFVALVYP